MRKIIVAMFVFIPALFLSGCYVTSYPDNTYYTSTSPRYYVGYTPGWQSNYYGWRGNYYRSGWYGNRWHGQNWRHSNWHRHANWHGHSGWHGGAHHRGVHGHGGRHR